MHTTFLAKQQQLWQQANDIMEITYEYDCLYNSNITLRCTHSSLLTIQTIPYQRPWFVNKTRQALEKSVTWIHCRALAALADWSPAWLSGEAYGSTHPSRLGLHGLAGGGGGVASIIGPTHWNKLCGCMLIRPECFTSRESQQKEMAQ